MDGENSTHICYLTEKLIGLQELVISNLREKKVVSKCFGESDMSMSTPYYHCNVDNQVAKAVNRVQSIFTYDNI